MCSSKADKISLVYLMNQKFKKNLKEKTKEFSAEMVLIFVKSVRKGWEGRINGKG